MISNKEVLLKKENGYFITDGLQKVINHEIKLFIKDQPDQDYENLLNYFIDYILQESPILSNGQTIAYYSWLLKLEKSSNYFVINEANVDGEGFRQGAHYSIIVLNNQREECALHKVIPTFPTFSQNIVISKGVYEGLPIDAVRYSSPTHMTGWWLTTDQYDSNINSLMNVHYFHVAFKRPDILRYLALPTGYRFYFSKEEAGVWFDDKVD